MVKSGKAGDENLKSVFLVWLLKLKLKIETKMRKGKYVLKIKTDHLDTGPCHYPRKYTINV
jgi:hypothetical protein